MKKCFFYLLFCLGMLCAPSANAWNNTDPAPPVSLENDCNLPAPTGITAYQPNPYAVTFNWNAVPGATGYMAALYTIGSSASLVQFPVGTTATFSVNPGDSCLFIVSAKCPNGQFSGNTGSIALRTEYVITELVVSRGACTPGSFIMGGPKNTSYTYSWDNGDPYIVELIKDNTSQYFEFTYKTLSSGAQGFEFRSFDTNSAQLRGLDITDNQYHFPPVQKVTNLLVTTNTNPVVTGRISFATSSEIYYYAFANELAFPNIRIYHGCVGYNGRSLDNGAAGPEIKTSLSNDAAARQLLNNIRPANPFSDQLPLIFLEYPEQALTARLFDASGRRYLEQRIAPEEVSENYYALPTATLPPGFYFLQVEAAPGVVQTWKVVKG